MQIFGVDFTSAPSQKKPITVANCQFDGQRLTLQSLLDLFSFEAFEAFLSSDGPWVAGLDFPFSLPEKFVRNMNWPPQWAEYVSMLDTQGLHFFLKTIRAYRNSKPKGQKYLFRDIDKRANACSPMMIDYTPVGRMFFQGAHRLLKAGVHMPPLHETQSDRVALEAYPSLVARRLNASKQSYKSDAIHLQTVALTEVRRQLVQSLLNQQLRPEFGFSISLGEYTEQLIEDASGDRLDALFCAIQATWAYTQHEQNYGIPQTKTAKEGWIIDPKFKLN